MDDKKYTITIPAKDIVVKEGGKYLISAKAEEAILQLIKLREIMEEIDKELRDVLQQEMQKTNTIKIEGENVRVYRARYGAKYSVLDAAAAEGFIIREEKIKPDSKAIEEYVKNTGELPDGITNKVRQETISIRLKEQDD